MGAASICFLSVLISIIACIYKTVTLRGFLPSPKVRSQDFDRNVYPFSFSDLIFLFIFFKAGFNLLLLNIF